MSQKPDFQIVQISANQPEDLTAILDLFGDAFEDAQTYCAAQPDKAYHEKLLASDNFIALAALHEEQTVGALTAYVLPKPERERSEIYIYDLAVAEHFRRKGIGTGLIEKVKELAIEKGAWVIFVQADHDDEPPIALYTKLGEREDVLHFDIAPAKRE
ncbi:AAC(3)-I family aminoglycoside N-acetyltransferase [Parasphingorhabdus halotolerans]|uniref:AAC(3)-I family aminoglycoside N-acetyltransferase n=1 Tax=Parasphingorhabdus halotolerans TaxID=2725558 RepID=A0A6H2DPN6_9SPHN|nr:AAC(3)-I family aminoglycoside N-acetyltransferase [Parasphingorhabdus halotolerans]QJB69925.1 AAC(3)-I family aminoglycoside N-acetyltransferase [Parasphingorhabdus halotolerans]